jgi:hypothetical protein
MSGRRSVAALGAAAVVVAALVSPPSATLAEWTDPDVAAGTFTAYVVPPPTSPSCTTAGLFVKRAELDWAAPTSGLPTGMKYEVRVTNITATPPRTVSLYATQSDYTLSDGLLSGLLNGLLTGDATLRVQILTVFSSVPTPPSTAWRSMPVPAVPIPVEYTGGLLVGSFQC